MKRTAPWAEDIEKAIAKARADQRELDFAHYGRTLTRLNNLASEIMNLTAAFQPQDDVKPSGHYVEGRPAPKRKAVQASQAAIDDAYRVLSATKPPYLALSPRNVAKMWNGDTTAYRVAGAALKALVADGRATLKRGKYAQVEPKVEDGLSPTADV